ncbi:hybrid sensor histidine kinase/response regulator [Balneola vulgaris]|uniref:hybrid sensor histidine kinase/response regulator n=1 Tax=Balneola vulgaris TaxID=287535 RepID=UPI0003773B3F|nr:response regulator [Balneola vulgaris]
MGNNRSIITGTGVPKALYFLVLFMILSISPVFGQDDIPKVEEGVIDLTEYSLYGRSVPLYGEWEFYWESLIPPSEIALQEDKNYRAFTKLWNEDYTPFGYATYRAKIKIPRNRPTLALQIPDFYLAFSLYLNGKLFHSNGVVGTSKENYKPNYNPRTLTIDNIEGDEIEIVVHTTNFHHRRGGSYKPIFIGDEEVLHRAREQELAYTYILTGTILMGGFFFLGLFLFGTHEKAILYFSLFCIVYSYRIAGTGIYPIHFIMPGLPWILGLKLEYLTLYMAVFFFGEYTVNLYPHEASRKIISLLSGISLLFALSAIVLPVFYFTNMLMTFFAIMVVYILYTFLVYVRAAIHKRDGSLFATTSTTIVFFVFFHDLFVYMGYLPRSLIINAVGYISFFFFQSLVLSYRFSTSLKRVTAEAQEASRAKSQFLSTMSHEIRTPLNAIIGLSGLLSETKLNIKQYDFVKTIKMSGENLLSIINNILDYSKIESNEMVIQQTEFELREIIENALEVVAPLNNNPNVELIYDIDEDVPAFIISDPVKLQQILVNLINNAIKFTEEGEVFVSVNKLEIEDNEEFYLKVNIKDTGIGISEEGKQKLFQSFSQVEEGKSRKYGGTGLGLVISKRLSESMGGSVHVESALGIGTTFTFTIRVEAGSSTLKPFRSVALQNKRAFLLDDNKTNLHILSQQLTAHNIEVETATHFSLTTGNIKDLANFDIMIMDMHMPKLDGVYIAKEIRKEYDLNTLPIVLLSSIHNEISSEEEDLFNLHLTKPVKHSQLIHQLDKLFQNQREGDDKETRSIPIPKTISDKRVLVAEDNIFNQKVAIRILERLGYKADIAENGIEAYNEIMKGHYDIVFMDIEMPEMDGIETTIKLQENLHKLDKAPIIIAMTANALNEDKQRCLDSGMDDFIAKPITLESLYRVIKNWV